MGMLLTEDMTDFIRILQRREARFLIVGGFAVNYYGYIRTTQDIDLLIYPSRENAGRMMDALKEFGFGNAGIPRSCFEHEGNVVHLGVEPNRIDLLTSLKGLDKDDLFDRSIVATCDDLTFPIISYCDLLAAKMASSRAKDRADVEELKKIATSDSLS